MRTAGVVGVLCSACSFTPGTLSAIDGAAADSMADADDTTGWSTPVELTELAAPGGADDPSLTADLLEIYFGSRRTGSMSVAEDIWVAKRLSTSVPFDAPANVAELNTVSIETTPKVTADGRAIFFSSNRATASADIWVSTRPSRSASWGPPGRIVELATSGGDYAAFGQANLLRLVFCSGPAVAEEALFTSERANTLAPWGTPARITELDDTAKSECDPNEPHAFALYYATDLRNADGTYDIYRASRTSEALPYGSRTDVSAINLPGFNDRDPWVSADERTMVFSSDRNGVVDSLYITTR